MACIDFLIWVGTPKKRSVTLEKVNGKEKRVYKPARYSTIKGYIKEAEELGCCRRIPQLPSWAVPGKSRVFLVHKGDHERRDLGSIFGYYTLKRVEFIAAQEGPDPIESYRGKLPWSDEYYQAFKKRMASCQGKTNAKACIIKRYPKGLKLKFPRDVCREKFNFNDRPSKENKDLFQKLVEEAFKEFMKKCWEEFLERLQENDFTLVPGGLAVGGGGLGCSKRKKPGAVYLVNALYNEITDAYRKRLYDWLASGGSMEELEATESKVIYPEEGNKLYREAKSEVLASRKPKAGELVLFDEPYPIFQRSPYAAFRGYLRIDGDELLDQIKKGTKPVTPIIPYCTGREIEEGKPMTKPQLVYQFASELGLQRKLVVEHFHELYD